MPKAGKGRNKIAGAGVGCGLLQQGWRAQPELGDNRLGERPGFIGPGKSSNNKFEVLAMDSAEESEWECDPQGPPYMNTSLAKLTPYMKTKDSDSGDWKKVERKRKKKRASKRASTEDKVMGGLEFSDDEQDVDKPKPSKPTVGNRAQDDLSYDEPWCYDSDPECEPGDRHGEWSGEWTGRLDSQTVTTSENLTNHSAHETQGSDPQTVTTSVDSNRASPAETSLRRALNILNEVRKEGINAMPERDDEWEQISVIIDSGASVPVMPPGMGKAYELEESEAFRRGTEYECANGQPIANLGQKRMPVVTAEGTLRGYTSQCADVSKPLQSVRHLVRTGHAVIFDDQGSYICNKTTGELNAIVDDGINYSMPLWVVPPACIRALREQAAEAAAAEAVWPGFTRQAR